MTKGRAVTHEAECETRNVKTIAQDNWNTINTRFINTEKSNGHVRYLRG